MNVVINSTLGSFRFLMIPQQPFAGQYVGTAKISVFGGVGLPVAFRIVTSPDNASLANASQAWLLLDVSRGNLFSPVEAYANAPEYLTAELIYDTLISKWVAVFENEFVLADSALSNTSTPGQIGRILRFEIEPFEKDMIIGRFSDRWEGFYSSLSASGVEELVDVVFEGDLEMTRQGDAPTFTDMRVSENLSMASPGAIPSPPTNSCSDATLFAGCGAITTNIEFENASNDQQIACALSLATLALGDGNLMSKQLEAFLNPGAPNATAGSFSEFLDDCAKGTNNTCVPNAGILCARQLLAHAYQNQSEEAPQAAELVKNYSLITREAFLGRQLAAFKIDTDTRLEWLKTSDYPAIVTSAVKDLIGGMLSEWQAGVLDVHMAVLGGYFDASGLAVLTRTTNDEDAKTARARLFSEMIQAWRSSADALSLATARWDHLYTEAGEREIKSEYVTSQMFDLYLMAGILTNITKDSGSGYQATAFGNGFAQLMRRAGMLSLSFDDKIFSRDAEIVVSTSLSPEDQETKNTSLLANLQKEATAEIARASQSVQTVLAETQAALLDETQLNNQLNNEINDLRTELVGLCGLPVGCSLEEFRTNEQCRVLTAAGQCGFAVEKESLRIMNIDATTASGSDAEQALLAVYESGNSVKIANEEVRAFNEKLQLEFTALNRFIESVKKWDSMRAAGLKELKTLLADQGAWSSQTMNELEAAIKAKAEKRGAQIARNASFYGVWTGVRLAGAATDLALETGAAAYRGIEANLNLSAEIAISAGETAAEALPMVVGTANDATSAARASALLTGCSTANGLRQAGILANNSATALEIMLEYNQAIREATLQTWEEGAALADAITEAEIAALEDQLELAAAQNDDEIGALQEIYDVAVQQRNNELAYFRDLDELEQRRKQYKQMLEDSAGLSLRVERAKANFTQRVNAYLKVVQTAELQDARLRDLEAQRADVNGLVGSPAAVFAKSNKLSQAETRLQRAREKLMDWLVGLEYYAVRPFMDQRVQIHLAVNPYQLEDIAEELKRLEASCGGAQNTETTEISVRRDLMNLTSPIVDEVTGEELSAEERFRRILSDGYVPIDKRVRYSTDSTIGDLITDTGRVLSSTFDISMSDFANLASTCNAKVVSIAIQLVGDIGTANPTVTILYDGTSQLRSCQPGITEYVELIGEELTNFGEITMLRTPGRSISPLAGINGWRTEASANATLGGLPLASQYTVLIDTQIGENARLNWNNLQDILLNVTYSYQDVFPQGQCN